MRLPCFWDPKHQWMLRQPPSLLLCSSCSRNDCERFDQVTRRRRRRRRNQQRLIIWVTANFFLFREILCRKAWENMANFSGKSQDLKKLRSKRAKKKCSEEQSRDTLQQHQRILLLFAAQLQIMPRLTLGLSNPCMKTKETPYGKKDPPENLQDNCNRHKPTDELWPHSMRR